MNNQALVRLDTLTALVNEKTTAKKDAGKPYIGLEHIPSGSSKLNGFAESTDSISTNNIFRRGDILFGKLRPQLRKSVRAPFDGYCSTDILVLRPRDGVDPTFAAFVLQSDAVFSEAIRTEEGTKMPRCSWGTVKDSLVYCPEPSRQKRLGLILSVIDQAIEKTEALIEKYQQIKAGLMHDLFTRGIGPDGKLRPPRKQAPELYQETLIGWIPKEWTAGVIGGYALIHNHLRCPISAEVRENMQGEYPYYGPTGIFDYLNEYRVEGKFATLGEDGDHFLKSDRMDMSQLIQGRANVNNHAHILSGANGCSTEWLFVFFLHRDITYWLTRQGAGRYKLNKQALEKLPIAVPPEPEQKAIVERVLHYRDTISSELGMLEKLKQKKAGLMHDLLTGKVPVNPDPPEPADA